MADGILLPAPKADPSDGSGTTRDMPLLVPAHDGDVRDRIEPAAPEVSNLDRATHHFITAACATASMLAFSKNAEYMPELAAEFHALAFVALNVGLISGVRGVWRFLRG